MLEVDWKRRLTIDDIRNTPWFTRYLKIIKSRIIVYSRALFIGKILFLSLELKNICWSERIEEKLGRLYPRTTMLSLLCRSPWKFPHGNLLDRLVLIPCQDHPRHLTLVRIYRSWTMISLASPNRCLRRQSLLKRPPFLMPSTTYPNLFSYILNYHAVARSF